MLNKEMLMTSQVNSATDNTVELEIGDGGVGDYGYCGAPPRWGIVPHGTLDRIPYWYGSIDAYFALDVLNENPVGKATGTKHGTTFGTYFPGSGSTPSRGQEYTIKVTRCDTQQSITFSGEHGQLSTVSSNALGLTNKYPHYVTLKFDPPPTAIYSYPNHLFNGGDLNARKGNASPCVREIEAINRKQSNSAVVRGKWILLRRGCQLEGVFYRDRRERANVLSNLPCNDSIPSEVDAPSQRNKQCIAQSQDNTRGSSWTWRRGSNSYRPIQACNNRRLQRLLTSRMGGSHA